MKIYTSKEGATVILSLCPTNADEAQRFQNFCRIEQPLTASRKKCASYEFSHIEIRKPIL